MVNKPARNPTKLRVLMSGHLPPPFGGMATYYQSVLASSLQEQVDLCFVQTSSHRRTLSESGSVTISNLISAAQDCGRFTRAVLTHRPHVSHIGTAFGLSFVKNSLCVGIARMLGSRVLLHPHCSLSILYAERPTWWRWLFRRIIRLTHGVIALSSEWMELRVIDPNCVVHHVPNAIDLKPYRGIAQERMAGAGSDHFFRILYLGYLGRAKGSYDLIDAVRALLSEKVEATCDLVGEEVTRGEKDRLRERIDVAKLDGSVRLHSPVFGLQKANFFRGADVLVCPSHHEGMPMVVLEAMACGLPIVATNVGGLPDLVQDGVNGLLVAPRRPDQLAAALHQLAIDGELRRSMQLNSYRFASERYDMAKRVDQLVDVYRAALS